ncbi:MAG: hypothetical protein A2W23_00905 [Planctomycetes bacterium RBG_16_43_13]|nr:MAG: hypothetical protein A2W23_00905 [Planctomycetes bacterium RBG_16_43_13]
MVAVPILSPITGINPNTAVSNTTVSVTITGTNYLSGAKVSLVSGNTTINGTNVVVVNSTQITVQFNLTGATTGQYNVVVTNPDDVSSQQQVIFTVNEQ